MGNNLAQLVFQPPQSSYPCKSLREHELIWLTTSMGENIPSFHIERPPMERAHFTLLFSHGNAEDLGLIRGYFEELSRVLNVNVFCYEYTGYGPPQGRQPSESSVYADIEAAFTYLRDVRRVPWEQIIAYGRSIGTAPSIHLATMTPVRGLILQSPMTSIFRIPFRLRFTLPGDVFSNIDKIGNVCCPVFVIHGTRDEIVPCWHGQALHDACVKKGTAFQAYVVEGGDHNDLERFAADTFNDRFRHFLQHLKDTPVHDRLRSQAEIPTNLPLVDSLHPASGRTNNRA
eukprot:TRINITY_DN104443_c0_g1_i1.p1 TRINITY_DN104443_c0_g1~~TRINITY_DN104443_c0_g1_i1.p1  ORF type:complete len:287 (-),score=25.49 TRINITY_DN104443_c0_g1_i1:45-905(-)